MLLLLHNAPGHFDAFERDGVKVVFFPPNCTSWKQSCDMGIIAALKKRYKYQHLKNVLSFYGLEDDLSQFKQQAGSGLRRGAVRVQYGNPANLLDSPNYIKLCWDSVTRITILNFFKQAEIMSLDNQNDVDVAE